VRPVNVQLFRVTDDCPIGCDLFAHDTEFNKGAELTTEAVIVQVETDYPFGPLHLCGGNHSQSKRAATGDHDSILKFREGDLFEDLSFYNQCQFSGLEPRLTRQGYNAKVLADVACT
jgi:hypothetical protein